MTTIAFLFGVGVVTWLLFRASKAESTPESKRYGLIGLRINGVFQGYVPPEVAARPLSPEMLEAAKTGHAGLALALDAEPYREATCSSCGQPIKRTP